MSGIPDHSRTAAKPYIISRDSEGRVRLAVRETRYNGQGYPLESTTLIDEPFKSAAAARAHAREHYGAEAGQFATK
jgi:hypothetical protein